MEIKKDLNRIMVFLFSGAFITIASCMTVYDIGLDPHMGMNLLINAMVAMIIGGVWRFGICLYVNKIRSVQHLTSFKSSLIPNLSGKVVGFRD